ncbi:hypothetical protein TSMEX_009649 [Taenia solium]|eukprot:TsM_001080100 transcript=TsM_001080100 gene=TsM_001080100
MYGIGFGLNYSTTPSIVLEWYPNNQCLACGSVFFGLGVGSIVFSNIQTYLAKPQKCDFTFLNGTNCEAPDQVPSVFMINGSIIFAVQMLGTVLMKKKELYFSLCFYRTQDMAALASNLRRLRRTRNHNPSRSPSMNAAIPDPHSAYLCCNS